MKAGSVLCMHRLTEHSSLASNFSNTVRWSFDLRYQPVGYPTGREEYPSFLVRSRKNGNAVVTDHHEWAGVRQMPGSGLPRRNASLNIAGLPTHLCVLDRRRPQLSALHVRRSNSSLTDA